MVKEYLTKAIALTTITMSIIAFNPIGANAAWKQNSTGWWYTEGNSWANGLCFIEGKEYYFDENGYMKIGWIYGENFLGEKKWFYSYSNGEIATNTVIDGYVLNAIGEWVKDANWNDVKYYEQLIKDNYDFSEYGDNLKFIGIGTKDDFTFKSMVSNYFKDFKVNDDLYEFRVEAGENYDLDTPNIIIEKNTKNIYVFDSGFNLTKWKDKQVVKRYEFIN